MHVFNGVGYEILRTEEELFDIFYGKHLLHLSSGRLNDIADVASNKINSKDKPRYILKTISDTLTELGYATSQEEDYDFRSALIEKKLACRDRVNIFLTIGGNLNLPLYAVLAPHHAFIRWDNGNERINWETTVRDENSVTAGKEIYDDSYVKRFKIMEISINKGVYLKNLTREEFFAVPWNEWGVRFSNMGKSKESIECYDRALEFNPTYPDAYTNKAAELFAGKEVDNEILLGLYEKALELDPLLVTSLYNKARTLSRLGRIKEAKITVEEAFAAIENRKIYYQDYRKDLEHMKKHIEEHLGA